MGHIRLGNLPRTRKWAQVVALIDGGADTAQVANATIRAAEQALMSAAQDAGLTETVYLLSQLPLAARSADFIGALRASGLNVSDSPSLMEILGAFTDAIDDRLHQTGGRTDLGEMAQMSAVETINREVGQRAASLFGTTSEDVRSALGALATNKQFSSFSRDFFARLTNRCLDYFLSRTLSTHIGEGHRFATTAQKAEFQRALDIHCREASKIVETFSGGWFSKTNWEQKGIDRRHASGFTHVAMTKIVSELKAGAKGDDN